MPGVIVPMPTFPFTNSILDCSPATVVVPTAMAWGNEYTNPLGLMPVPKEAGPFIFWAERAPESEPTNEPEMFTLPVPVISPITFKVEVGVKNPLPLVDEPGNTTLSLGKTVMALRL